jgi:hypothetical protein
MGMDGNVDAHPEWMEGKNKMNTNEVQKMPYGGGIGLMAF